MREEELFAGVDEVGRGSLAGAVLASAVVLRPGHAIPGLRDSKALTSRRRERLDGEIRAGALCWSVGRAEVWEIDELNILQATMLAMRRAVEGLAVRVDRVIVDGNRCPDLDCRVEAMVKGDSKVDAIMAASIVAKVARDREMVLLDEQYPGYGLARNKGYGTRAHIEALRALGPLPIHRRTFAPVRRLQQELPFAD